MKTHLDARIGRRGMLCGLGAAAVSAGLLSPGGAAARQRPAQPASDKRRQPDEGLAHGLRPADDEVRAYLGPLREGAVIGGLWRLESVHGTRLGAIPLVLSRDGERFAVELLRWTPGDPRPIAHTGSVGVYLSNRGDGARRSDESAGLGAMALARALERRERAGARAPVLMTHAERRARHPMAVFHIPLNR